MLTEVQYTRSQDRLETQAEANLLIENKYKGDTIDQEPSRMHKNLRVAKYVWAAHFVVTMAVMLIGVLYNGGTTKYVPANIGVECHKGYVNVLATSVQEEGSTICCDGSNASFLCVQTHPYLYKQLTRLPGAWILPLVPFFLGQVTVAIEAFNSGLLTEDSRTALLRLLFYIVIFSWRGWALFLGANILESVLVESESEVCWFSDIHRGSSACHGLQFDFSDHTVLYFGQILSISLVEFIHIFVTHHWNKTWTVTMTVLFSYLPYLYYIALFGEFNTAAYFHTRTEILVGYSISLLIQLPLVYLQCSARWERLRYAIFGISDRERND